VARYTYGDSALAAERLRLVASMFEPATATFLRRSAPRSPRLAIDLGCGPGLTTRLVHEVTGASVTVGLDGSAAFVEMAAADAPPGVSFMAHDATSVPFPVGPADLVYARLLLAHLPDPASVVSDWSTMLTSGGIVMVDDLETIETDEPVFRTYLDEVALAVVAAQGGALFVGPMLHDAPDPASTTRVDDRVVVFAPDVVVTASVFAMNLDVLTERGEVEPRPDLAAALRSIAGGARAREVRWHGRHLAWRRA